MPRPPITHQRRGRVRRAAERALMVAEIASTADVAVAAYCRKSRPSPFDYRMARAALARIADPIGRGGGRGRPLMWRKRNSQGE